MSLNTRISSQEEDYIRRITKSFQCSFGLSDVCFDFSQNGPNSFSIIVKECEESILFTSHIHKILNISPGKIEEIIFDFGKDFVSPGGIEIQVKCHSHLIKVHNRSYTLHNHKNHREIQFDSDQISKELDTVCGTNKIDRNNDFKNIKDILFRIYNMDEFIPELSFSINTLDDSTGYIISIEGVRIVKLSFIEYLIDIFINSITDIKLTQTTNNENGKKINTMNVILKSFKEDVVPLTDYHRKLKVIKNVHGRDNDNTNREDGEEEMSKKTKL